MRTAHRFRAFAPIAGASSILSLLGPGACLQAQSPPAVTEEQTAEYDIRIVTVTDALEYPWSVAFLPNGDMLVTERPGRLRLVRDGRLDPTPVAGLPDVYVRNLDGLLDVALHPRFADNGFVYLTYAKPGPPLAEGAAKLSERISASRGPDTGATKTVALARGRWNGTALTDVRDIFVADNWIDDSISTTSGSRLVFGPDGMLYMSIGAPNAPAADGRYAYARGGRAQDISSHGGKILRLRDDGTVPPDNPFVGRAGYRPEIFTLGNRNPLGLAVQPRTAEVWENENGPADGDEINVLRAGANYGWPLVGMGYDYSGDFIGGVGAIGEAAGRPDAYKMYMEGMEQPRIFWTPTVAPSGMTFYTGDRFSNWDGDLFIGTLRARRLERHVLDDQGHLQRREYLLEDLNLRIRDVREGPDGLLYVLTDHATGALLRIEPAQ